MNVLKAIQNCNGKTWCTISIQKCQVKKYDLKESKSIKFIDSMEKQTKKKDTQ